MIYKSDTDNGIILSTCSLTFTNIRFLKYRRTSKYNGDDTFDAENCANNHVRRVSLKWYEVRTPELSANETLQLFLTSSGTGYF